MKLVPAAALATLIASPSAARADEALRGYSPPHDVPYSGGAVPSYAHLEERSDRSVIDWGLGITAISYGMTLLYALGTCGAQMDCRSGSAFLYIPVVGPFFTASQAPTTGGQALSVFDGTVQTVGAAVAIWGLTHPRHVVVWQDPDMALGVSPGVPGGAGLTLTLNAM